MNILKNIKALFLPIYDRKEYFEKNKLDKRVDSFIKNNYWLFLISPDEYYKFLNQLIANAE